jgi:pilus assembly protein CpaE
LETGYVLRVPPFIEEGELISAATVEATLKVLRELFDVVMVDCGTHLSESSIVAWERSDHLLYIIDQTVTAIRAAQRFLNLYNRLGLRDVKPSFVINRYVANSPITQERIETALGHPIYARLPRDEKSYAEQQVTGEDLWKIRSAAALREDLEALARKLSGVQADEEAGPGLGLFGRLLRGFGPVRRTTNGTD